MQKNLIRDCGYNYDYDSDSKTQLQKMSSENELRSLVLFSSPVCTELEIALPGVGHCCVSVTFVSFLDQCMQS